MPASREEYDAKVQEALQVRDLLLQNTEEMDSVVKALNGGAAVLKVSSPSTSDAFSPSRLRWAAVVVERSVGGVRSLQCWHRML